MGVLGRGDPERIISGGRKDWDWILGLNLGSVFICTKAVLKWKIFKETLNFMKEIIFYEKKF